MQCDSIVESLRRSEIRGKASPSETNYLPINNFTMKRKFDINTTHEKTNHEQKSTENNDLRVLDMNILSELDVALANDVYYTLQSLLKDSDDDYNDKDVELNYEEDRDLFEHLIALHYERKEVSRNFNKMKNKKIQEFLMFLVNELTNYDIDLEETKAVCEEYELDWIKY